MEKNKKIQFEDLCEDELKTIEGGIILEVCLGIAVGYACGRLIRSIFTKRPPCTN